MNLLFLERLDDSVVVSAIHLCQPDPARARPPYPLVLHFPVKSNWSWLFCASDFSILQMDSQVVGSFLKWFVYVF